MIFCAAEFYIFPISHINVVHVLRQRMPIITPFNASNAMSKDISAVRLVPSDHIAMLLSEFTKIAHNNSNVAF